MKNKTNKGQYHRRTRSRRKRRSSNSEFLSGIGVPEAVEFVPDDFQLKAIESIGRGEDTLVIAPTGAGKTWIAIQSIHKIVSKGDRAIYTTPLKALSNSKYSDFRRIFEPEWSVGLLTGDRKIYGDSSIIVATTEIYRNELFRMHNPYQLVVLDEFHYLADYQRGPVWEESVILSPRSANLLMLSASVSNDEEIAEWVSEIRQKDVRIIKSIERPVELRLGFLDLEEGAQPLADKNGKLSRTAKNSKRKYSKYFVGKWKHR